jgi:hypothetical protein
MIYNGHIIMLSRAGSSARLDGKMLKEAFVTRSPPGQSVRWLRATAPRDAPYAEPEMTAPRYP